MPVKFILCSLSFIIICNLISKSKLNYNVSTRCEHFPHNPYYHQITLNNLYKIHKISAIDQYI
jgi:hypothetical protein